MRLISLIGPCHLVKKEERNAPDKSTGSVQVVFCCCSSAVCWLAGMVCMYPSQPGPPLAQGSSRPQLPGTVTCLNHCHYNQLGCVHVSATMVQIWGATCLHGVGSHGCFSSFTASKGEWLTKMLISKIIVRTAVWESRLSRDCFWRLVA